MAPPISVHLHSLREQMRGGDHLKVLAQVAEMGYQGVETAGFHGLTPAAFARAVADLGMVVSSNHTACPTKDSLAECVDVHQALGTSHAVCGFWDEEFRSVETIKRTAARLAEVIAPLARAGITVAVHNHWQEFERLDGRLKHEHLVEACPEVQFEIDAYWAANFGANDPAAMIAGFRQRLPLLQLKDGPLVRDQPHTAVGRGSLDIPAIVAAADQAVLRWVVVELGTCATGMVAAIADSYAYLVGKGLAAGRRRVPVI